MGMLRTLLVASTPLIAAALAASCGDDGASGSGGTGANGQGGNPTCTNCTPTGDLTFALPSPPGATVWTTTTMDKVLREAAPPTGTGEAISVLSAKNPVRTSPSGSRSTCRRTQPLATTPQPSP